MPKLDTIAESLPKYPLVLVLGHTGHGKSTFIKSLLGPEEGKKIKIDGDYHSCTQNCDLWGAKLAAETVYMVDTPGFDDTFRLDTEILLTIIRSVCSCQLLGYKIKGIIYVFDITSTVGGKVREYLSILRALCGPDAYRNVIFATTKWRAEDSPKQRQDNEVRQDGLWAEELADFRHMGARCHRYTGNPESSKTIVTSLIGKGDVEFQIEKEMHNWELKLLDTKTGKALKKIIAAKSKIQTQDINTLERELEEQLGGTMGILRQKQEAYIMRLLQMENVSSGDSGPKASRAEPSELAFRVLVGVWNESVKLAGLALSIVQIAGA